MSLEVSGPDDVEAQLVEGIEPYRRRLLSTCLGSEADERGSIERTLDVEPGREPPREAPQPVGGRPGEQLGQTGRRLDACCVTGDLVSLRVDVGTDGPIEVLDRPDGPSVLDCMRARTHLHDGDPALAERVASTPALAAQWRAGLEAGLRSFRRARS